ncbi:FAD-dependent monooxygenase [Lentzea alba]|uniref:FAD-dependent oxidoreductase n=1 Tax=Lentzea alba TaxID=2714351 RepID=UPI0039BFFFAC
MKVIIIGGGPVSCLAAIRLRTRGHEVRVYERGMNPLSTRPGRGNSFNLTLTERGLRSLPLALRDSVYRAGVELPQRVIHHKDGSLTYQPYGVTTGQHLLSIPRNSLHRLLLAEAKAAGAQFYFDHECFGADPRNATAQFVSCGKVIVETADLLIGCDGANSTVRHEISRRGGRLDIRQFFIPHGYVELTMPPDDRGLHSLLHALRDPMVPESSSHGLHVWPREDFMLLAQPNRDQTYTATLFMPLRSDIQGQPSIEMLRGSAGVVHFFEKHLPDSLAFLPELDTAFFAGRASALRTIACDPFHHGRTVLLGDAAHTLVPFYGQGINCSFEDVQVLMSSLEQADDRGGAIDDVPSVLARFTQERSEPVKAITELSLANLRELSAHTDSKEFHARNRLELKLHARYPELFAPLYHLVAFSELPYHLAVDRYTWHRRMLDELCWQHDLATDEEVIIRLFVEQAKYGRHQPKSAQELIVAVREELVR